MIISSSYLPAPHEELSGLRTDLDSPTTLVLIFSGLGAAEMEVPVKAVQAAFPQSVIMGCSTAGEVVGGTVRDGGMTVAVARFERTELTTAWSSIVDEAPVRRRGWNRPEAAVAVAAAVWSSVV
jgi:hypothetical protein